MSQIEGALNADHHQSVPQHRTVARRERRHSGSEGLGVTPQPFGSRLARPAPLSAEDQPVRDQVAPHGYDPYPPPLELHDLDEGTRTVLWNYIRAPRECHALMRTQIVQMYDQSSSGGRLSC